MKAMSTMATPVKQRSAPKKKPITLSRDSANNQELSVSITKAKMIDVKPLIITAGHVVTWRNWHVITNFNIPCSHINFANIPIMSGRTQHKKSCLIFPKDWTNNHIMYTNDNSQSNLECKILHCQRTRSPPKARPEVGGWIRVHLRWEGGLIILLVYLCLGLTYSKQIWKMGL